MTSKEFDFIIIGGGLAGLVLATRISELPDIEVLVIEAGDDQTSDPRVTVPAMWQSLIGTESTWNFKTTPQEGLQHRQIKSPQGRILGGSAALNGLAFSPPSKALVDAWAGLGNPGWDWPTFSAAMRKAFTLKEASLHGDSNGPIQLTIPDDDVEWRQAWSETLAKHDFTMLEAAAVFSGQLSGGFIVPDSVNPTTKQRSFPCNAYLAPIANTRGNLTIWTQTVVNKVLFSKDTGNNDVVASGVELTRNGHMMTVAARREVLVTAGALNSPRILEISGVGDADRLRSLGIEVIIDNRHVGENLQNHPMCGLSYEVLPTEGFRTMDGLARQDPNAVAAAMEAYATQKGPLAKSSINIAAHLPLQGGVDEETLATLLPDTTTDKGNTTTAFQQAHASFLRSVLLSQNEPSAVYLLIPGFSSSESDGTMITAPPGSETYISLGLVLAHPLSKGSVHITSNDDIAIDPGYLTHAVDIEVLARHLQFVETLASTEPLANLIKPGGKRNPGAPKPSDFTDLGQVKEYLRKTAMGAAHYSGTCAMMPREIGGVVDPELRVYGCRNLRVCDASIIPMMPQTNTQATVYGIAERAAEIIKSSLE